MRGAPTTLPQWSKDVPEVLKPEGEEPPNSRAALNTSKRAQHRGEAVTPWGTIAPTTR
jgi:hypothetical protein